MTDPSITHQVKHHWEQKHAKCRGGISLEDIKEFEASNKVIFPIDFREYLTILNGMLEYSEDDDQMRFYPLEQIRLCNIKNPKYQFLNKNFYIFADFSIGIFHYAIELLPVSSETNNVYLIAEAPILMAQSFTEFLKIYLAGEAFNY